ncbi:hypothetical protein D3C81_1345400 [compost metagenome]
MPLVQQVADSVEGSLLVIRADAVSPDILQITVNQNEREFIDRQAQNVLVVVLLLGRKDDHALHAVAIKGFDRFAFISLRFPRYTER